MRSSDISVCSIARVVSQSNEQEINVGKMISMCFDSTKYRNGKQDICCRTVGRLPQAKRH